MAKEEKAPYGYIYRATNRLNEKVYIGQTITSTWKEDQVPIVERWKKEVREAYGREKRGEDLRRIERAIVKYGPENFDLEEVDRAYSQEELDEKETYWVKKYDSMNPDKGYNMTEGGLGGRPNQEVKDKISDVISEKYQQDPEYYDKQVSERRERAQDPEWIQKMTEINRERAQDPEWINKMTEINQEIARNPEIQEKMSKALSKKWQDQKYQDNVSQGVTGKWQEPKYRERQFKAKVHGKREIKNIGEFINDIREMKKKDLNIKYDMDGKSINKRIKEMLGHRGVHNFSEAKDYIKDKNLAEVVKDIKERQSEQARSFKGKKEISNKREFLADIQNLNAKEISQKYNIGKTTVNIRIQEMLGDQGIKNYTEAKNYLKDKNLDKVVKDISEKLKDRTKMVEGTTMISNKREFLQDIQQMQKNEIDHKYEMDAKTVNNKIKEMLGEYGVKNYTDARAYLRDKDIDEVVNDIEERTSDRQNEKSDSNKKIKEKSDEDIKDKESLEEKRKDTKEEPSEEGKEKKKELPEDEKKEEKSKEVSEHPIKEVQNQSVNEVTERQQNKSFEKLTRVNGVIGRKSHETYEWIISKRPKRKVVRGAYIDKGIGPGGSSNKDYDGIDKGSTDKSKDYKGIVFTSTEKGKDYSGLAEESTGEKSKDFAGIDKSRNEKAKDYEYINEGHGEGGGGRG